jgi:long-chain fatty acid transport protein
MATEVGATDAGIADAVWALAGDARDLHRPSLRLGRNVGVVGSREGFGGIRVGACGCRKRGGVVAVEQHRSLLWRRGWGGRECLFGTCIATILTFLSSGVACPALALGIRTPEQGAAATGQAGAFLVQADDASAIYYNPGGLTQLHGTHLEAGLFTWFPRLRFDGGGETETMDSPAFLPHFYVASDLGLQRWRVGIAVNNDFGTLVDWGIENNLRFLVTEARLNVFSVSPAVAYHVAEGLSLGVSLNAYRGDAKLKRNVLLAPPPFPEGRFTFRGDGHALGVTAGVLLRIGERHAVGLVYRSPFAVDLDGSSELAGPTVGRGPSSTTARIDLPQIVGAGYAFRPTPRLKIEIDVEWTNWDTVDRLAFRSSDPTVDGTAISLDWEDSFTVKAGVEYRVSEHWTVRGGYAFWQNSVPTRTFSPLVPDSDLHSFTTGLGYATGCWRVDVAYLYNHWTARTVRGSVNSPIVDGKWESDGHSVTLSAAVQF